MNYVRGCEIHSSHPKFAARASEKRSRRAGCGFAIRQTVFINIYAGALALICLALAFTTACGSGNSSSSAASNAATTPEAVGITATGGTTQSGAVGKTFSAPLEAKVTSNGIATSGEKVTFTAPASGPSGTFANGTTTETDVTNTKGIATSSTFTANTTAGTFMVTAAVSGAAAPVTFALTNIATTSFSFYLSGQETATFSYYALAGSVLMDSSGNVLGGVQDYNDGEGVLQSKQPAGDTIIGGTLTVDATSGQGTLTLITNNPFLGVPNADGVTSTETFAVQFANSGHALIMQFDGTATSSGSMDLQTLPSTMSGAYAFTVSGFESGFAPVGFGGVFTTDGATISNGTIDINDAYNFGVTTGTELTGTLTAPDSYGRGTIKGVKVAGTAVKLNYYMVNSRAIRLIDVDLGDSALGSAFSQGSGTFSNASLGTSVFAMASNPYSPKFAAIGQFTTSNTSSSPADFVGNGDDNEPDYGTLPPQAMKIKGTYSIGSNGYGSLTFTPTNANYTGFGDIITLGIYMTDPTLNLNDPNNTVAGSATGGALVVDMDSFDFTNPLPGGTGILVPQTEPALADFNGTYVVGWQNFTSDLEFDMISQGSMTSGGALSLTGMVSDPFFTQSTPDPTSSTDTFTGTPKPDVKHLGRYTMLSGSHLLASMIDGTSGLTFGMILYQASGSELFWMDYDDVNFSAASLGTMEQQGSLAGLPAANKTGRKLKTKRMP